MSEVWLKRNEGGQNKSQLLNIDNSHKSAAAPTHSVRNYDQFVIVMKRNW